MAWQDEMIELLRVMANDLESAKYSDDTLERTLVVAAFQVLRDVNFPTSFAADLNNTEIRPDPTIDPNRNDSFINLTTLKAACIIDRGEASKAATQAISVRDGSSAIDLRGNLEGKLKLLDKGWCAVYEDAKYEYQRGLVTVAGAVVLSPFRVFLGGGPNTAFFAPPR